MDENQPDRSGQGSRSPSSPAFALIGAGELARLALSVLADAGATPAVVFSDDDKLSRAETGAFAAGSDIRTPAGLDLLERLRPDWLFSIDNFDYMIPSRVLDLFGDRAVNLHFGLLPEYAGRHGYQWAIRHGERETGVTLHEMTARADAGAIIAEHRVPIPGDATGLQVFQGCRKAARQLIQETLPRLVSGDVMRRRAQDPARRRLYLEADIGDGQIDWTWPARAINDFVRAANFEPFSSPSYSAWTMVGDLRVDVLRLRLSDRSADGQPGEFLRMDNQIAVVAGDGKLVEITRAAVDSRRIEPGELPV